MDDENFFDVCKAAFWEGDFYSFREAYLSASDETRCEIREELLPFVDDDDFKQLMIDSVEEEEELEDE